MIKHFRGHKFLLKESSIDYYVCVECGVYAYKYIHTINNFYIYVEGYATFLDISCDEVMIKKLLE